MRSLAAVPQRHRDGRQALIDHDTEVQRAGLLLHALVVDVIRAQALTGGDDVTGQPHANGVPLCGQRRPASYR